jgi:17 kDa outer membrane surface antigen
MVAAPLPYPEAQQGQQAASEGTEIMSKKIVLALCAAMTLVSAPAFADDGWRDHGQGDPHWAYGHNGRYDGRRADRHDDRYNDRHNDRHGGPAKVIVVWQGQRYWSPPPRPRVIYRAYGPQPVHHYHHDYRRNDHDDWALYAVLALQLANALNDSQQDSYAWAQQRAVAAPLGESIQWRDSGASGSVTAVRDGVDAGGRYCREFQHQITVGNRAQEGYGTACLQPDGAWQIVS